MLTAKKVDVEAQDQLLTALESDHEQAEISVADRVMLDYVVKLTRAPWTVDESDVERLRELGFDDAGIHDMCTVAAYFGFVNRIADGLGVELEERFDSHA